MLQHMVFCKIVLSRRVSGALLSSKDINFKEILIYPIDILFLIFTFKTNELVSLL